MTADARDCASTCAGAFGHAGKSDPYGLDLPAASYPGGAWSQFEWIFQVRNCRFDRRCSALGKKPVGTLIHVSPVLHRRLISCTLVLLTYSKSLQHHCYGCSCCCLYTPFLASLSLTLTLELAPIPFKQPLHLETSRLPCLCLPSFLPACFISHKAPPQHTSKDPLHV